MRVLVTGIGGFIGSHVMDHLLVNTDWEIVGIDSFRHKGLTDRITDSAHYQAHRSRVVIFTHDLSAPLSRGLVRDIGEIDVCYNLASDSHVDRSIEDPVRFVQNNVNLALTMFEWARVARPRVFFQISTDEVYGPAADGERHAEWSPILPSNPYAASKAAQEAIAISYWRSYGVPVVLTNTMNNFGERQDPEKYLPKTIRAVLHGHTLTVHGTPGHIGSRFYLHARNHADALLWLSRRPAKAYPAAKRPDRYNIVGEREVDNLQLAQIVADILDKPLRYELVDFHSARPGHDRRYALDGRKIEELGWRPPVPLERALERTIRWYLKYPRWLELT